MKKYARFLFCLTEGAAMPEKKKKPQNKGVARVPVVMQLEALECGAACLDMILAYYGKWIPLEQVRIDCGISRDGSKAINIIKAASHYGLKAAGYRFENPESLEKEATFPCIIHWNHNHFVVLDGFRKGKAYINDPGNGCYSVSKDVFDESFTGIALLFEPTESFEPSGKPKSMMAFAKSRLKDAGTALIFTSLISIITALIGVLTPVFSRVFLDNLLNMRNPEWLGGFVAILVSVNIIQIIVRLIDAIYSRRISGKLAAVGNSTYMWKVLNLPMSFFSQRMSGDIQMRQSANAAIAETLVNTVAPLFLNAIMLVFYLVVMIRYSLLLTAVGLLSVAVNSITSMIVSQKRINITRVAQRDAAKLSSATVSGISMIETIKASGAEAGFFARWSGYQANVNAQNVKYIKLNSCLGMIPAFISTVANSAVMILGVYLTMKGRFTVGMIMAFQGFLSQFMAPAQTFIDAGQTISEMRTQMERIEDVMKYNEDSPFAESNLTDGQIEKLGGNIEVRDVTFGYSPLGTPVIKNFSMSIEPGESVAIVGSSGCGKSTMSKLISGLYKPWSGEILFDGKPMKEITADIFRSSVAVVDQDIILFEDTIASNIKMWDNSIEDYEMILAARDAQIHYDIMQKPGGYQYRIIEGGRNFSGGQRQRIEIARALAQDPTIIILDEATSALDAKTEYNLVRAVRDRGITSIVIAHRLSTIRSCDRIIVLKDGEICDVGTHMQLMETSDIYRELVTSE